MKKIRTHFASHGLAWLDFLITAVALLFMLFAHLNVAHGPGLLTFKWAQISESQIAAHLLLLFLYGLRFDYRTADKVDKICVIAVRLGFAYCFSVAG